ncbi:hypothetical protein I7I53_04258 [Histoplasma capsulatum var. duboisii H88]|uniref:Uncharacterized protein n=1 Tax=Ajellomyces capsulatus (strain H88) TaxID=544711 RepID=A0A8A1LS26_AJEC8|nr:hypothetical protein I7I53_04258 [Histoplasma capsulatum var. duboisii H88]
MRRGIHWSCISAGSGRGISSDAVMMCMNVCPKRISSPDSTFHILHSTAGSGGHSQYHGGMKGGGCGSFRLCTTLSHMWGDQWNRTVKSR